MRIQQLTIAEAIRSLQGTAGGLTSAEARRRLAEYGPNQIERVATESVIRKLGKEFSHFFALVLWIAAALAFIAAWERPGQGMGTLGLAIVAVILINGLFAFWQQHRAERAIAELQKLLPHQVKAVRDGTSVQIPAYELVPGDIILLTAGDAIPADCRLIQAFGVLVNTSAVTGESLSQPRDEQPSDEPDVVHATNILLGGTSLVSGEARALVSATGSHSEFGRIARLTQTGGPAPSPLQREINRVSRLVAVLATLLGGVFFGIGRAIGLPFWESLLFGIGIIVANVPEGLLPTVTLALAMGSQRMARRSALIRHLPSVETLGSTTVICTDKTGTLTENRMTVKQLFLGGCIHDVADLKRGCDLAGRFRQFFDNAAHCQTLQHVERNGQTHYVGDPLELALVEMAQTIAHVTPVAPRVTEIPFDTNRKRLSTLHRTPEGLMLFTKGALEAMLPCCRHVQVKDQVLPINATLTGEFLRAQDALAAEGLRVLAMAYRPVSGEYSTATLEQDLILCGLAGVEDPPRPEVPAAIARCRQAGIRVIMVTGDHPHTAAAIARQIGLTRPELPSVVVTGDQLRRMSDIQLQLALDAPQILFARVGADQKMRIVIALQRKGDVVATTGDGVNDAPALKQADIGIAMGRSGTDVAREASDMVLLDDNFASIVAAVEEGRAVYANIRKFLTYILTSNIPEIVPYLAFALFRIPLPLTVVQILAVDLGTDMLPALALGAQPPEPEVMAQPPRPAKERLMTAGLVVRAYLFLGILQALAAMAAFFFVLQRAGWHYGQSLASTDPVYRRATTACLAAIIIMQVVNVFLCRSASRSAFQSGFRGIGLVLAGVATEIMLILLIVYTPGGQWLFGTAPVSVTVWLFLVPFAAGMLLLEELRKWLVHRPRPLGPGGS